MSRAFFMLLFLPGCFMHGAPPRMAEIRRGATRNETSYTAVAVAPGSFGSADGNTAQAGPAVYGMLLFVPGNTRFSVRYAITDGIELMASFGHEVSIGARASVANEVQGDVASLAAAIELFYRPSWFGSTVFSLNGFGARFGFDFSARTSDRFALIAAPYLSFGPQPHLTHLDRGYVYESRRELRLDVGVGVAAGDFDRAHGLIALTPYAVLATDGVFDRDCHPTEPYHAVPPFAATDDDCESGALDETYGVALVGAIAN